MSGLSLVATFCCARLLALVIIIMYSMCGGVIANSTVCFPYDPYDGYGLLYGVQRMIHDTIKCGSNNNGQPWYISRKAVAYMRHGRQSPCAIEKKIP